MVRLPFGACGRETAPTFNISQPLLCSGSLLPYSYSHSGLFIHEPPHMLPTNSPNLAHSPALDSSKWVLSLRAGRPLQLCSLTRDMSLCDLGYYSAL